VIRWLYATLENRSLAFTLAAALLVAAVPGVADARPWKPTAEALALDYAQIIDQRSPNEMVLVMWLAPEIVADDEESDLARQILADYLVVAVVHGDISDLGQITFRKVASLDARTFGNTSLAPLDTGGLPPAVTGVISIMQGMFTQALGAMGQGTNWFVFDGSPVTSCGTGGFSIPYAGEVYEYATPIPGCP